MNYLAGFLLGFGLLLTGCSKDDNGVDKPGGPDPDAANLDVQDFMYKAMNLWYFWQGEVDILADGAFATDAEYTEFLEANPVPGDFFDDVLRFSEDRFSFYSSDYKELTQNLSGISRNNGLEFGLVRFSGSDDIFGYVWYVLPGSDAASKEIQRGDIFTGVNGTTLNISNYVDLLFGEAATYTLNMATIANGQVSPNGEEVTLTKEEGFQENPVFLTKTFDVSGTKIGYLMYNGFTNEFDEQLNEAFGQLKSDGATELVIDFRYNGGGSVNSSRLLSSMIYGTNTNDLYIRQRWNAKIQ
ncbi:MAG: carboxyl-terminal protease, partial [Flavobacteriaceae bacterium]|nr:carboxyl-terminal protease [Flavobacteriaceae bacterium]